MIRSKCSCRRHLNQYTDFWRQGKRQTDVAEDLAFGGRFADPIHRVRIEPRVYRLKAMETGEKPPVNETGR